MMRRIPLVAFAAPLSAWAVFRIGQGHTSWEYLAFFAVPLLLALGSAPMKRLFVGLYPLGIVGVLYDGMHFVEDVGVSPERVHLCDLRSAEARLFGITIDGHPATVHDWLQAHATPALDLLFAIPYATFLFAYIGMAVLLWIRDYRALIRFSWCFLFLNVAGFVSYHLYPAAPPWYFHTHGCVVDVTAKAWEGPNLARVDGWLGVSYFHGMYARSSDVFGAMPSLHVAYPLVILLEGWPWLRTFGRALALSFFATMCAGAVYLDHHWVLDVVAGLSYGLVSVALVRWIWPLAPRAARTGITGAEEMDSIARS